MLKALITAGSVLLVLSFVGFSLLGFIMTREDKS